jgi:DNA-binding transcriptional MerR regulator
VDEPWTIVELAELAAQTLAAPKPAGSLADAGTPSGPAPSGVPRSRPARAGMVRSGPARAGVARSELARADMTRADMARSSPARANGRVRDVPNERLVRWYVTVGLVDPPLSRRGRVARYGRRHLLQLVAVKRRQAEGRSLAEIQAELAGATDDMLAAVARVPDTWPALEARPTAPGRFWARQAAWAEPAAAERPGTPTAGAERREPPTPAGAEPREPPTPATAERLEALISAATEQPEPVVSAAAERQEAVASAAAQEEALASAAAGLVRGVRLAPGVTLLLEDTDREPGPDDVAEIVSAARPLLEELASRRLYADHLE